VVYTYVQLVTPVVLVYTYLVFITIIKTEKRRSYYLFYFNNRYFLS